VSSEREPRDRRPAGDDAGAGASGIVFRADSICCTFGSRTVLNAATLWARRGCITVVLGRNGSGKSTLLRVAAGLQQPDQGVVIFAGHPHVRPRLCQLGLAGLFYVPERGLLMRNATVRAHFTALVRRFGGDPAPHLQLLQLEDLLDRMPDSLSGGERRRAEVALALTRDPVCLLADEPLMGIAPRDAELLGAAFRTLAQRGCGVVVTGHEVATLLDFADEVIWLTAGTTHSLGTPAEALRHWQFRREYLGTLPPIETQQAHSRSRPSPGT
jgi:ABC-type multidrug transport system ATPase subunit